MKVHELPQFTALHSAASTFKSDENLHLRNLCSDSSRCAGLVATHSTDSGSRKIIIDYSRQQVTGETMELLFDLADKVGLTSRRDGMRNGSKINATEGRSVLHHALRMPKGYDYSVNPDGKAVLDEVHAVRDKIEAFTNSVRNGEFVGVTGKQLKNFVCIGIGGSQLGPEFVNEALRADPAAAEASSGYTLRFLGKSFILSKKNAFILYILKDQRIAIESNLPSPIYLSFQLTLTQLTSSYALATLTLKKLSLLSLVRLSLLLRPC